MVGLRVLGQGEALLGGGGGAAGEAAPDLSPGTLNEGVARLGQLAEGFVVALPSLGAAVVVLALFVVAGRLVNGVVRRVTQRERKHNNLALALGRLAYGVLVVVGVLVAAVIVFPGFTPTSLLTSLGVGSLVLGLAFKDVLQNYLAGVLLLVAEPFRSGDQVKYGDFEGTVEDIQTRATFIRTYDGRRIVVPNAELFTHAVTVNTAFDKRRIEYDVGIGYGDDIDRAKAVILEAVRETGSALTDPPPEVLTYELAASTVNLRVRWWIQPPVIRETFDARDKVLQAVKARLTAEGIDLPFPTTQVLFHDQTEATDGDRRRQREGWPMGRGEAPRARGVGEAIGEALRANGRSGGAGERERGG